AVGKAAVGQAAVGKADRTRPCISCNTGCVVGPDGGVRVADIADVVSGTLVPAGDVLLLTPWRRCRPYSHSIVPGGFDVTS
ncbi:MAG: hypothetical protein OEY41_14610, partial [Acidimicrobiia bacterium]|nr:hypothetical protein [Acidimicrobiia bacterium]